MRFFKSFTFLFSAVVKPAVSILGIVWYAVAGAQPAPADSRRLDEPFPVDETCQIKLGTGPLLRVPASLVSRSSCLGQKVPLPVDEFSLVINYPDMRFGQWTSAMSRIFAKEKKSDILRPDKFPVRILYIFYPEHYPNPDDWSGPNPPVWKIKKNLGLNSKMNDKNFEPIIRPSSEIKGLRQMSFSAEPRTIPRPPGAQYDESLGLLIEPKDADYDLVMDCDNEIECEAYVQLKRSGVQYRFEFPNEAAHHAADVISSINHMIEIWLQK